jgi:hypothetical protein
MGQEQTLEFIDHLDPTLRLGELLQGPTTRVSATPGSSRRRQASAPQRERERRRRADWLTRP